MQKAKELREKSKEELVSLSLNLSKEIYRLKNEIKISRKIEKPHLIKHLKKERARALTVLSEKN